MLTFTVPGKPIPKGRPRVGAHGTITPQRTKAYEADVGYAALAAMPPDSRTVPLYPEGDLCVQITFYTNGRGDVDNLGKSILDGLNRIAWNDDFQVVDLRIQRFKSHKTTERAEVVVATIAEYMKT